VLPDVAREHTTAGAKAFVRYYIDVLNYAALALSPARLDDLSPQRCELCTSFVEVVRRVRDHSGHQEGGELELRQLALASVDELGTHLLVGTVSVHAGSSQESAQSRPVRIKPTRFVLEFHVGWHRGVWHLSDLRLA
jgi:Family of unknown function (DUF6318)